MTHGDADREQRATEIALEMRREASRGEIVPFASSRKVGRDMMASSR